MKKFWYILPIFIGALMMTSCEKQVEIDPALLVGRWAAPSSYDSSKRLVFVFQNADCTVDGTRCGRWGYQFDEGDGVYEEDLLDQSPEGQYHKNGWFGWTAATSKINLIHMTSIGKPETGGSGAVVITPNKVTAFDGRTMTMVDEGRTYIFKKVVEK